jgi:hypothetical protein
MSEDEEVNTTTDDISVVSEGVMSVDSKATQLIGLVWCWSEDIRHCGCEFHQALRAGNWRASYALATVRHYHNGPIHSLNSDINECDACEKIREALHKQKFGVDCDCWYCVEKIDNDDLTDDGSSIDEFEGDIEYIEYREH